MLSFLQNLLFMAEAGGSPLEQPGYLVALKQAVEVLEHSPATIEAVATLQGYQAFMSVRGGRIR